MEKVGIGISTYKRTKYFIHMVNEIQRTNAPMEEVIFFVDGDDEKDEFLIQVRKFQKLNGFKVVTNSWSGHRGNFLNIGNYFREQGYDYFFYIEDDTIFCKNWYEVCVNLLEKVKGFTFGLIAPYSAYPYYFKQTTIMPHVQELQGYTPIYGSCAWLLSIHFFKEIAERMEQNHNPDTAVCSLTMRWKLDEEKGEYVQKNRDTYYRVFIIRPNIAQHLGVGDSSIKPDIPLHKSFDFYGQQKDARSLFI